jgi:uncharacterized membrane protein (DUF2068 family)
MPSASRKRPLGLILIVAYKCFVVGLLMVTTVALWLTLANHRALQIFVDNYFVGHAQRSLTITLLSKVLNLSPRALKLSGIATAAYAVVSSIEAIGLWYEKAWAELLVLVLLGASLPPEIFELTRGASLLKWLIFGINLASFIYVLQRLVNSKFRRPLKS